jgi:hypothetical protein
MGDQVAIIKSIAKSFRKHVRSLNLFDPTVCTSPRDPEHPWKVLPLPGDIFRHQVSLKYRGRKVRIHANAEFMFAQVSGSFGVNAFSINRRRSGSGDIELSRRLLGLRSLPVFARQSSNDLEKLLNSAPLKEALDDLQLKEKESLHVYTDAVALYLQRETEQETIRAIEVACRLADQLPPGDGGIDLRSLPSQFKELEHLIKKWGVTDDEERNGLLEGAARLTLERLVDAVTPHLTSISQYLDSFAREPLPEAAIALGALAECTLEAKFRLSNMAPEEGFSPD